MNNLEEYKNFLEDKEKSFWMKAKQKEFRNIEEILEGLKKIENLTTRNSITLRILGFVINLGNDDIKLSQAGKTFIKTTYKQKILDEQLMKVYLNGKINPKLAIDIIPLKALLLLSKQMPSFSFEEYEMFVCWIHSYKEIDSVVKFIKSARNMQKEYKDVFDSKLKILGIKDFSDNVSRLMNMLRLSSYFNKMRKDAFETVLKNEDADVIINTFDNQHFTQKTYQDYLTTNDGWEKYDNDIEIVKIMKTMKENDIKGVELTEITLNIASFPKEIDSKKRKPLKNFKKIDYLKKAQKNLLAGDLAEKLVVKYERKNLDGVEFAQKVTQVSLKNDTLGYDILSFTKEGTEKHIEVKGVANINNSRFSFYMSDNEIQVAKDDEFYCLYIVFEYLSKSPKVYKLEGLFKEEIVNVKITAKKYLIEVLIQ